MRQSVAPDYIGLDTLCQRSSGHMPPDSPWGVTLIEIDEQDHWLGSAIVEMNVQNAEP